MAWADEEKRGVEEAHAAEVESLKATIAARDKTIRQLRGEEKFDRCRLCFTTDNNDHAGWCPRKEG